MSLVLGDNFSYGGSKPLDARLKYNTLAEMKAVADATMYNGCTAYCEATDKTYQWKSTNTVDETLGRWREFSSGGGTGGGHTIEDSEGTSLTQRDKLQFGEGFKAEDDDTNEKTVISPDVMQSGDMSDVITPLPSVQPRYHKYSTEEQIVGEWIDGRPIYQKTFYISALLNKSITQVSHGISNIGELVSITGTMNNGTDRRPLPFVHDKTLESQISLVLNPTTIEIANRGADYSSYHAYVTIQYTKTTDTPNT